MIRGRFFAVKCASNLAKPSD